MSRKICHAGIETELVVAFLHRLLRSVEPVPSGRVAQIVLLDELQERTVPRLLRHAHQV